MLGQGGNLSLPSPLEWVKVMLKSELNAGNWRRTHVGIYRSRELGDAWYSTCRSRGAKARDLSVSWAPLGTCF